MRITELSGSAVGFAVMLSRFFGMLFGVYGVTLSNVGVVACFFVIAGFVVFGRFTVVPGRVFEVFSCFFVVFCSLMAWHPNLLRNKIWRTTHY